MEIILVLLIIIAIVLVLCNQNTALNIGCLAVVILVCVLWVYLANKQPVLIEESVISNRLQVGSVIYTIDKPVKLTKRNYNKEWLLFSDKNEYIITTKIDVDGNKLE